MSKQVMECVMEEVIINASYNVVICRNENNNTYENLFFILI